MERGGIKKTLAFMFCLITDRSLIRNFDHIYFSTRRPIWPDGPPARPHHVAARNLLNVKNGQCIGFYH